MRALTLLALATVLFVAADAGKTFIVPLTQKVLSGHEIGQFRKAHGLTGKNVKTPERRKMSKLIQRQYKSDYLLTNGSIGIPSTIPDDGCAQFQTFQLAVEVGSAWTFVLSPSNPKLTKSQNAYHADLSIGSELASSTYGGRSGTYNITGSTYRDYVQVNNYIFKQHFGVASQIWTTGERKGKIAFPVDGVLGLSWVQDSSAETPIKSLCNRFKDEDTTCRMILWLDTHKKPSYGTSVGKIIFDHDNTGQLYCDEYSSASAPLNFDTDPKVASFNVGGLAFGSYSTSTQRTATVNSGFSEIVLPEDEYDAIINQIDTDFDDATGLTVVDCGKADSLPDLVLTIGGTPVTVSAQQYLMDLDIPGNQCVVAFSQREDSFLTTDYTLGNAFIRAQCVEFDNDSDNLTIWFHKNKSAQ